MSFHLMMSDSNECNAMEGFLPAFVLSGFDEKGQYKGNGQLRQEKEEEEDSPPSYHSLHPVDFQDVSSSVVDEKTADEGEEHDPVQELQRYRRMAENLVSTNRTLKKEARELESELSRLRKGKAVIGSRVPHNRNRTVVLPAMITSMFPPLTTQNEQVHEEDADCWDPPSYKQVVQTRTK